MSHREMLAQRLAVQAINSRCGCVEQYRTQGQCLFCAEGLFLEAINRTRLEERDSKEPKP